MRPRDFVRHPGYVRNRRFARRSAGPLNAPTEAEHRPSTVVPYRGPRSAEELAEQLREDPEFLEWMAEERAAELAMLTRRALR